MTQTHARNELDQQRQREWLAGTRRVYADEVDYGGRAGAQDDFGRGSRVASNDKLSGQTWKQKGPHPRAMA